MRGHSLLLFVFVLIGAALGCGDNASAPNSIADHVRNTPRLSALEDVLRAADLLDTLDEPGSFTLFAFVNEGYDANLVPDERLDDFAAYHVHVGEIDVAALERRTAASTLEGTDIHIRNTIQGVVLDDGVQLEGTSITTGNGIIHFIDRMLVRPVIAPSETFESNPNLLIEGFAGDSIFVEREGFLHNVRVSVDIAQQDVSNLFVYLEHVDTGTFHRLIERPRTNLSNLTLTFADGAILDAATDAEFSDEPTDEAFPAASYRAFEPLEYLVGEPVQGEWSLRVFSFGRSEEDGESRLRSWGLHMAIGEEMPAPALVFNPRRGVPGAFGQGFKETAVVELRRVGGAVGAIDLSGSVGELEAAPVTLAEDEGFGALVFTVPANAEPGTKDVALMAQLGDVSRIASFDSAVATPQALGMELLAQIPLPELDAVGENGNDIWGWTDPMTGAEIVLMGTSINTTFVDVSNPSEPVILGYLSTASSASLWRDMKVYADHAFVVSEADEHGLQVFDLTELRGVTEPQTFSQTAHRGDFGAAHNIFINEDSALAYVVGSDFDGCHGGILVYDVSTPAAPTPIECFSGAVTGTQPGGPLYPTDVYTHDLQCVIYAGPDTTHQGKELCFSADEESIAVADFSDPENPRQIVRVTYDSVGYSHQGWLTEDHEYFILNDEFDEFALGIETRSYVWDMRDVDNPELVHFIDNPSNAVGHNTYIAGDIAYQANYTSGLRLIDVSDIDNKNTPEIAYYDTNPDDDDICQFVDRCGIQAFDGAWSNYPFFESGTIVVSDTLRGLFILKRSED